MSDNKKYYYIRIKEDFFEKEDIKILQAMDDGYLFSDILMKLYLKSLKDNGKLMFKDHIPYNAKMISTITNHSVAVVEKAINIFAQLGLIEILDNGAIYMLDIQNFIGRSSSEGDRKREYRKRIEEDKLKLKSIGQKSDKCLDRETIEDTSNQVIEPKGQKSDIRPPETETETEIEIETELEQQLEKYFDHKDIKSIAKYCFDNDVSVDVVVEKFEIIKSLKRIRNKVGALLTAIKEDWKPNNSIKNSENMFEPREYDYDSLEKRLLGWESDDKD